MIAKFLFFIFIFMRRDKRLSRGAAETGFYNITQASHNVYFMTLQAIYTLGFNKRLLSLGQ